MTFHRGPRKPVAETHLEFTSLKFNPVILSLIRQKIKIMLIGLFLKGLFFLGEPSFFINKHFWEKPMSSGHVYCVLHLEKASNSRNIFAANKFTLTGKVTEDYLKCLQCRNDKSEEPSIMSTGNWIQSADPKRSCSNNAITSQKS